MIKEIVDQWEANKHKLEKWFRENKMKEYEAAGWGEAGPYRQYVSTGLPKDELVYSAIDTTKYHQIVLTTEDASYGGFQTFYNTVSNIIAIPQTDVTTITSILTVLDGLTNGAASDKLFSIAAPADIANNIDGTETITAVVTNPSGAALTYAWTQVSGPAAATLTNSTTLTVGFATTTNGTYVLRVTATDANGTTATDTISVTVTIPIP